MKIPAFYSNLVMLSKTLQPRPGGYLLFGVSSKGKSMLLFYGMTWDMVLRELRHHLGYTKDGLAKKHGIRLEFVPLFYCDQPPTGFIESLESAFMILDGTLCWTSPAKDFRLATAASPSDAGTARSKHGAAPPGTKVKILPGNLRLSVVVAPVKPPIQCKYCAHEFDSYDELASHVEEKHPDPLLCTEGACEEAPKRFTMAKDFIRHFRTYHIDPVFACDLDGCICTFNSEKTLLNH